MRNTQTIIIIFASFFICSSCRKNILDTYPYSSISSSTMWTTDNLTDLGVAGVYNGLRIGITTGSYSPSGYELYQMDGISVTGQMRGDAKDGLLNGTASPGSDIFANLFRAMYEGIQRANDAIYSIPAKSPSESVKKARYIAECKFLRAYYYFRLNQLYKGVPVYLEPITADQATKGRETEEKVWEVVLTDLNDCINETNLPQKYAAKDAKYGHITKGAAYALRGKVYMYQHKWDAAIADFEKVKDCGYALFAGSYKTLFKEANEQSDEMIFSIQNMAQADYGGNMQLFLGSRASFGSCWDVYLPSPHLVDLYEKPDGSKFNWDDIIPGFNAMPASKREVYFFRDNLTQKEIDDAIKKGLDMSQYIPGGNEARIKKAYENRDPRLSATVITPYSSYLGTPLAGTDQNYTMRWPFRDANLPVQDLRTDWSSFFVYLYRKFVGEGSNEVLVRDQTPIDIPVIRYADVLLMWAEALNEKSNVPAAIELVNAVRSRAGIALLQTGNANLPTFVSGQADMRERIRNERRVEFACEGIDYFDELRWGTLKEKVFANGNGVLRVWGENITTYKYPGDYITTWPIPRAEVQRNSNITPTPGWPY
ncbi:RagB/SusD family nutrient uptake outer membrane protein [Danxiaibacter flavus]|uniref:RagB/SusD family nutrient uptake outer membrane protein n=1 Tax=Danxiaibacter flavus TaxID=3049108 RepID=A0ABV3ZAU6_9BACT|nr:RagB/SusD family nutrient uptake outer membrane protein [Chitinophagaceae bacterium DXS]